jgi:hypothetical protein
MNTQEFVDIIREVVLDTAVDSVESNLIDPPGRKPAEDLKQMSVWYNSLDNGAKEMVLRIARYSARISVFGFFCVLDGVRAIESGEKGDLKLYYEKDGKVVWLNDPSEEELHNLL